MWVPHVISSRVSFFFFLPSSFCHVNNNNNTQTLRRDAGRERNCFALSLYFTKLKLHSSDSIQRLCAELIDSVFVCLVPPRIRLNVRIINTTVSIGVIYSAYESTFGCNRTPSTRTDESKAQ